MNLVLSDRNLSLLWEEFPGTVFIDLSKLQIANCIGCFGCWTKTPGRCVIRDDAVKVYPLIAASERILYVSRVRYGGYDTVMKTILERSIPIQQPFIRLLDGETHHFQRDVAQKKASIIGYGDLTSADRQVFRRLTERNAKNMNFKDYTILFTAEDGVDNLARKEIAAWKKS